MKDLLPMNFEVLKRATESLPTTLTQCGETSDLISGFVTNGSFDQLYHPSWKCTEYVNGDPFVIMEMINYLLTHYSFISIDIDAYYQEKQFGLEHVFCICRTDNGDKIIDSYVGRRSASIRDISSNVLHNLLADPSIQKWNSVFLCNEKISGGANTHVFLSIKHNESLKK